MDVHPFVFARHKFLRKSSNIIGELTFNSNECGNTISIFQRSVFIEELYIL